MIHLKFRRGEAGKSNYDVRFNFEYDLNLKKKISSVTLYNLDMNRKLTLPWTIFLYYVKKKPFHPFINSSGLKMWFRDDNLVVSTSDFNLTLVGEELESIVKRASRSENGFSNAVEGVLKEFISKSV